MSEWWTYSLSDFLLFSPRTYYRLFELYNLAVWPWHVVAIMLGVAVLALWLRGGPWQGRAVAVILAACWLVVAWAYLLARYDTINWAASYFAAGFALEALLLVWIGLIHDRLPLRPGRDLAGTAGLYLFVFALFAWPLIGPAGRSAVAASRGLRRRAGSHRGGHARCSRCGRSHALGAPSHSAALVRDQWRDLVDHAIAGRLADAGRSAAGSSAGRLDDHRAASASFAGLRRRTTLRPFTNSVRAGTRKVRKFIEAPRLFTRPIDGNKQEDPISRGIEPAPCDECAPAAKKAYDLKKSAR